MRRLLLVLLRNTEFVVLGKLIVIEVLSVRILNVTRGFFGLQVLGV
jgi:hypothetical protein